MQRLAALLLATLSIGGCATRMVEPEKVTEPVRVEIPDAPAGVLRATLEGWISPDGPGSWTRGAEWEEYLLRLTNTGAQPVRVESIALESALPNPLSHTRALDELTRSTSENRRVAAAGLAGATAGAMGAAALSAGALFTSGLASTTAAAAATAIAPAAVIGGVAYGVMQARQEANDRRDIEAQLLRRGHEVPRTLVPAESVVASAFVPLAQDARRLAVTYRAGDATHTASVDVAALTALATWVRQRCVGPVKLDHPDRGGSSPLFTAEDGAISVTLDRVVVPNGPGSWVSDAFWDEYHMRVKSLARNVAIEAVVLHDAPGRRVLPHVPDCLGLEPPRNFARDVALTAVPLVGPYIRDREQYERFLVQQITAELAQQQPAFPVEVRAAEERRLKLHYPVVPQPRFFEVRYRDGERATRFHIDVGDALARIRQDLPPLLVIRGPPERAARWKEPGFVRAKLTLDAMGQVRWIEVLESVPAGVHDSAARRAFSRFRYYPSDRERTAEARIDFNEEAR
jgi:TonB family protein